MGSDLELEFDHAMMGIYERALSEARYKASKYFHMLHEHRGLGTARLLINSSRVSDGYTALWKLGRLDLTVEALICENQKWHELFTTRELGICRKRLLDYGYEKVR
ncbi:MAG: hypothetical protein H6994_01960 [Pseudomonadales bacterium]|nr:hypothetical protein [Pseudomonadales bacterium]